MFLRIISPKWFWLEEAVVLNLYKINELWKHKPKIEILHDLKEFFCKKI